MLKPKPKKAKSESKKTLADAVKKLFVQPPMDLRSSTVRVRHRPSVSEKRQEATVRTILDRLEDIERELHHCNEVQKNIITGLTSLKKWQTEIRAASPIGDVVNRLVSFERNLSELAQGLRAVENKSNAGQTLPDSSEDPIFLISLEKDKLGDIQFATCKFMCDKDTSCHVVLSRHKK